VEVILSLNSEQAQTPTRSVDHIQSHNRHEPIFPSLAKMALNKNTVQQLQNSESRLKHYPVCCKAYHHLQVAQHLTYLGDISDEIMQNLNKLASAAASTGAMRPYLFRQCRTCESPNLFSKFALQSFS
jgi:hypothetical protein